MALSETLGSLPGLRLMRYWIAENCALFWISSVFRYQGKHCLHRPPRHLPSQQLCCHSDIMDIGCRHLHRVDKSAACIYARMAFHAKVPLVALFVWCISGSRSFFAFFVELGALMSVASTMLPPRIIRPARSRQRLIASKNRFPSPCSSNRWAELQQRCGVRHVHFQKVDSLNFRMA